MAQEDGRAHPDNHLAEAGPVEAPPAKRGKALVWIILLALLIPAGWWGYREYQRITTHTGTDDAYLTADITQVSAQVNGTVTQVLVKDNQVVKPGQLLVVLDEANYKAAVAQARANLEAAVAAARAAHIQVSLTAATGSAQITQAQGVVGQAQGGIGSAEAELSRSQALLARSNASARESQANISTAVATVESARANKRQAQAAVSAAAAQVLNSRSAVRAAVAGVAASQADADNAAQDVKRYRALLAQGAISPQSVDHAQAASEIAQAKLEASRQQAAMATDADQGRAADLDAARERLAMAEAGIRQAEAQLSAAREHAHAVTTDISSAQAGSRVAAQTVQQAVAKRQQAAGQLQQAQTAPQQVAASASAQAQAQAKVDQAKAALDQAQINLGYCRIYAAIGGEVSKKSVTLGSLVQPGTPLLAIVHSNDIWVVANFKETQLAQIRPGQKAEITVDALHDERFSGRVESLAAATGATFALLPPENASGNFTKIVQRLPVKIVLDANQRDWDRLRGGMSVAAEVTLNSPAERP
jgi:membrane fusion protein, multidrug efflux system